MDEINIQKNKNKFPNESISPSNKNQINNDTKNLSINTNTDTTLFPLSEISSDENASISPIKLIPTSASSKSTLIEPLCKLEKFLPPLNILNLHKKTLVLDLDETLIHSYFDHPPPRPPDISFDIFIEKKKIHVCSILRPGVNEFLEKLEKYFEIVIFTASLSQYANPVLDFLDKKGICKFRLYREHCCCYTNGFTNSFIKDLKKLDRNMKHLIIIDNNPKSFMFNKENGVPIKTWIEDMNDNELLKLIPYLLFLADEKIMDVRPFLKEINSGISLNFEKFDKIIEEYNIKKEKELEKELININLQELNQNIYESVNSKNNNEYKNNNNNINAKKNKKNKDDKNKIKKENKENETVLNNNSNNKNNINEKSLSNKEIKENKENKILTKNNKEVKIDNKDNKENKDVNYNNKNINININDINNNEENKNKILETKNTNINININTNKNKNISKETKNINSNKDSHIENSEKEITNKSSNQKNLINNKNISNKKEDKKIENKIQNNNYISKDTKKEAQKKNDNNINILKRNENTNKELINKSKRNNSVVMNYNENIMRKFNENKLSTNKILDEKKNINEPCLLKKEEELLLHEYNTFDNNIKNKDKENNIKSINNKEIKNNDKDNNKTSRENLSISLNKLDKNDNNFFLKKISNINIYRNYQKKNEPKYNPTNELLNQFLLSLNNNNNNSKLNNSIKLNKSIQFSEQEKTIINDDEAEEEKKNEQPIFDDVDTEEKDENEEKKEKNINAGGAEIDEGEKKSEGRSIPIEEKKSLKKKRKLNKNLFNKAKINKYQLNIKNIKDNNNLNNNNINNKILTNELFLNNNININNIIRSKSKEKLDLKIEEKYDYFSKRNFSKDIFTIRKKDSLYNKNISTSNYKLFKDKEKPNIYLKNKSNMSNDEIDFSISNIRSKSKHNTDIFKVSNNLITGGQTNKNKNKLYKLKKGQDSIDFNNNNKKEKMYLFKNSILTKRPTSCVNKLYEGVINSTSNNTKIERNKKVIRFSKQDKKIYLKTNNDKKISSSKKTKINLENINNIDISSDDNKNNEDEDSKENNNIKEINNIINNNIQTNYNNNKSPKRNIFTDFSLKNVNVKETNNSNKKIKFKNKVILL